MVKKPTIVCLCGSTRYTEEMLIKQWELTKQGVIVLSWCALPDTYDKGSGMSHIGDQEGVMELVDEVHKRKIDMADRVHVLNINGYIGESTRSEINYAIAHGKPVTYEEPRVESRIKMKIQCPFRKWKVYDTGCKYGGVQCEDIETCPMKSDAWCYEKIEKAMRKGGDA